MGNDTFCHEQSLLIEEKENLILIAGCAHRGIVNILRMAEKVAGKAQIEYLACGDQLKEAIKSL